MEETCWTDLLDLQTVVRTGVQKTLVGLWGLFGLDGSSVFFGFLSLLLSLLLDLSLYSSLFL